MAAAGIVVAAIVSVQALDRRFDRADLDHAVQLVTAFRPPGNRDTLTTLMARAQGQPASRADCRGHITSSVRGTVRVTCSVAGRAYRFDVDLGRVAIHPADPATHDFLASLSPGGSG